VSVYTQAGAPTPAVNDLRVQVSYDHGKTWQPAVVNRTANGEYRVIYTHPPLGDTAGTVSLRAQASDEDGNRVEQTMLDAYRLSAASN
jgi:hypothetical protein